MYFLSRLNVFGKRLWSLILYIVCSMYVVCMYVCIVILLSMIIWSSSSFQLHLQLLECNSLLHRYYPCVYPKSCLLCNNPFDTASHVLNGCMIFNDMYIKRHDRIVKGSQLGTFCPLAIVYCYLEFKLRYLENLKFFSIRVKELFEPLVSWKKATGFCSFFYNIFLEKPIFE